jgi:hypothetical protein
MAAPTLLFPGKGDDMQSNRRYTLSVLLLAIPMLLFSSPVYADSPFAAWFGVWTIVDDTSPQATVDPHSQASVQFMPTVDGKGLEISRKVLDSGAQDIKDVKETLILDGSKQPLDAKNCTGWESSKWVPETGAIVGSSEVHCKDSGSFRTSSLKVMLAPDQMVDILGIITGDQTRVAARRLNFHHSLEAAAESRSNLNGYAGRVAVSAAWNVTGIIQLAAMVDDQVLQAALVEKNDKLHVDAKALRQMKAARLSKDTIDLMVALAFPDKFFVQTDGQTALQPVSGSTSATNSFGASFFPSTGFSPNSYLFSRDLWLYLGSPLWLDSLILLSPNSYSAAPLLWGTPSGGFVSAGSQPTFYHGKMTGQGYAQTVPIDSNSGRHAVPYNGNHVQAGPRSGTYINTAPIHTSSSGSSHSAPSSSGGSAGSSSGSSGTSSGSSSSSGSSAPAASGGDDGARRAVPR